MKLVLEGSKKAISKLLYKDKYVLKRLGIKVVDETTKKEEIVEPVKKKGLFNRGN